MTDRQEDTDRRRAELALTSQDAAVGVVSAVVGAALGPAGVVAAAFIGPYAVLAARRLRELQSRVADAGLQEAEIIERVSENEALAHLVASVARGTVESDSAAKRALLARAAVRALRDDAAVDVEGRFVRTAVEVDTTDVRVLAIIGEHGHAAAEVDGADDRIAPEAIAERWPGAADVIGAATATLSSSGLIESPATMNGVIMWRLTPYGWAFLDRLIAEGLENELHARQDESMGSDDAE